MAISMSVVLMAHPKREAFVPSLLASLDRPAKVVWDERNDRWDTGARAMRAYDPACSHHLVVQDDAIVCRDLVAGLEKALAYVPEPDRTPLCLYIGRGKPFQYSMAQATTVAERDRASWVRMTQIHWGVGIVMPTGLIDEMADWCDTRDEIANYDRRMSRWVGHKGLAVYYTWPSLVDHRISPSLVEGRQAKGRHAHRFIGASTSALEKRWDGPVIELKLLNRKQWEEPKASRKRAIHRPSHKEWLK